MKHPMARRQTYHVTSRGDEWQVKKAGQQQPVSTHHKKERAVEKAKELAKDAPLGQVVIHRRDGQIQTEHTYGQDPYPPKG
jgi:hypothetical protein